MSNTEGTAKPPEQRRRRAAPQRDPLHDVPSSADYIESSTRTMWRLIADGQLAVVRIRRRTFVRQSELDAFLERSTKPATK